MSNSSASLCTVQEPLSILYSTVTYAVDPELFCRESVEVFAPPEQLPSDCESVSVLATGQLTVELFISLAVI